VSLEPYRPRLARQIPVTVTISPQQAECLDGLMDGLSNAQIGARLGGDEERAKYHLRRLYRLLGAKDRAHAVGLVLTGRVVVLVRDPGGERAA
jgi:DNA-binding CsgD family transcriptional regulator